MYLVGVTSLSGRSEILRRRMSTCGGPLVLKVFISSEATPKHFVVCGSNLGRTTDGWNTVPNTHGLAYTP